MCLCVCVCVCVRASAWAHECLELGACGAAARGCACMFAGAGAKRKFRKRQGIGICQREQLLQARAYEEKLEINSPVPCVSCSNSSLSVYSRYTTKKIVSTVRFGQADCFEVWMFR